MPEGNACLECIVKGKLRDQGKQKQTTAVLSDVPCMKIAFHDQEAEYGKCQTADSAHPLVELLELRIRIRICNPKPADGNECADDGCAGMVNQHGDACEQLQRAAGKPMPGTDKAILRGYTLRGCSGTAAGIRDIYLCINVLFHAAIIPFTPKYRQLRRKKIDSAVFILDIDMESTGRILYYRLVTCHQDAWKDAYIKMRQHHILRG